MNKKITIELVIGIIVLIAIAFGWAVIRQPKIGPNGMIICAREGESISSCTGCKEKCCSGLKGMTNWKNYDKCDISFPPPGVGATCSQCGNGICDTKNNENKCTCSEDCKENSVINPDDLQTGNNINNYSCVSNNDCVIKNTHNCCGIYPRCLNKNAIVESADIVQQRCEKLGVTSTCEIPQIGSCKCENNQCKERK